MRHEKKALNVNLDELCEAMEDSSYENEYFLGLETGEVLFISDYMDDEETSITNPTTSCKRELY